MTSILSQLDDRFEVIVVDGGSTDGTVEAIKRMQDKYANLILICCPCSRGLGRDIAYRVSKGKYLIQQVDVDVIYQPTLQLILDYYHSNEKIFGNYALRVHWAFVICTSHLMDRIGGWPDLQQHEDLYVYRKLMRICRFEFNFSLYNVAVRKHVEVRKGITGQALEAHAVWRDWHRILPLSRAVEELSIGYLRAEGRSLPRKLAHIPFFLFGVLAQYTKTRYKLYGEDLRHFTWEVQYFFSLKPTDPDIDLIFESGKPARRIGRQ